MHRRRRFAGSRRYRHFVATMDLTSRHTPHGVGSVPSSEIEHGGSTPVPSVARRAAIPHGLGNPTFCHGLGSETDATSQPASIQDRLGQIWKKCIFAYLCAHCVFAYLCCGVSLRIFAYLSLIPTCPHSPPFGGCCTPECRRSVSAASRSLDGPATNVQRIE